MGGGVRPPPQLGHERRGRPAQSIDVVSHPDFARLHPTGHHPESPHRLAVLLAAVGSFVEAKPANREDLLRCHSAAHVEHVASIRGEIWLDGDTPASATSYEAALLAAGAAIQAAELGAFALARPPGHHALPGRAMGFCLFDNVAVAARWAQAELGVARVAILDWDVHHGNGTEAIFLHDSSVLFVSLHQWPFYPGTGGPGSGNETTINLALRAGSGDAEYLEVFERVVEPAIHAFAPDLLLVSAGFDAAAGDPLAGMALTEEGFREMARRAAFLAPRVGAVLEGGYDVESLPGLVAAARDGFG